MTFVAHDAASPIAEEASASPVSAVSWAAVLAGAAAAAAVSLILAALGAGLGMAAASPWPGSGHSVATFAIGAGIWLIVMQWLASAVGGYIAGRLRTRWTGVHTDEVFFRDTVHGFLTWCVATLVVAGVAATLSASAAIATADKAGDALTYQTDILLGGSAADPAGFPARAEISRLIGRAAAGQPLSTAEASYVSELVSARTGLPQAEAARRIDATVASVRKAEDAARKSSSATSIFTALSLLIGAFIASVAGALGGRLRDD